MHEVVNGKVKEYINTLPHKCIKMSGRTQGNDSTGSVEELGAKGNGSREI